MTDLPTLFCALLCSINIVHSFGSMIFLHKYKHTDNYSSKYTTTEEIYLTLKFKTSIHQKTKAKAKNPPIKRKKRRAQETEDLKFRK